MEEVEDGVTHQEICRLRDIIVIKVIRLQDLSDIMRISRIRSANLKVIHLLRHPVPMMMSRLMGGRSFYWRKYKNIMLDNVIVKRRIPVAWETYNYSYNNLRTIRFIQNTNWLKDNYLLVTHRQLSLEPLETARKIYGFINETLSDDIVELLQNITSTKVEGPLSSHRVSANVVDAWRSLDTNRLTLWDIKSREHHSKVLLETMSETFALDDISDIYPGKSYWDFSEESNQEI